MSSDPIAATVAALVEERGRGRGVVSLARYFTYAHLPCGPLRDTSEQCARLAAAMITSDIPDGAEFTTGLRKLLEAKDAFVRAALDA